MGINPSPLTLRELCWMADARQIESWNHTASIMSLLANIHRNPKKSGPFSPAAFHPLAKRRAEKPIPADISVLKEVFCHE